jgi:hypothetical protein
LWSALAGSLPWRDKEEPQLIHAILMEGIPPLASAGCTLDAGFEALIAKACSPDPRKRFATAREMHDELEAVAKRSHGVASHVQVAEHVERVMGPELAARRERIRLRRGELEAAERRTGALPNAQQTPVSIEAAFNPVEASTGHELRKLRRGSPLVLYTGVLALALAAAYAALTLYAGGDARETPRPPRAAAPAAPPPPEPVAPGAPQTLQLQQPPEAAVASEASEPLAPPPAAVPARPRLPERATLRKSHGISTRNPYRRDNP